MNWNEKLLKYLIHSCIFHLTHIQQINQAYKNVLMNVYMLLLRNILILFYLVKYYLIIKIRNLIHEISNFNLYGYS